MARLDGVRFVPICSTSYLVTKYGIRSGFIVKRQSDYVYIPDSRMIMFSGDSPEDAFIASNLTRDYKSAPKYEIISNGFFIPSIFDEEAAE